MYFNIWPMSSLFGDCVFGLLSRLNVNPCIRKYKKGGKSIYDCCSRGNYWMPCFSFRFYMKGSHTKFLHIGRMLPLLCKHFITSFTIHILLQKVWTLHELQTSLYKERTRLLIGNNCILRHFLQLVFLSTQIKYQRMVCWLWILHSSSKMLINWSHGHMTTNIKKGYRICDQLWQLVCVYYNLKFMYELEMWPTYTICICSRS